MQQRQPGPRCRKGDILSAVGVNGLRAFALLFRTIDRRIGGRIHDQMRSGSLHYLRNRVRRHDVDFLMRDGAQLYISGFGQPDELASDHNLLQRFRSAEPPTRILLVDDDAMQRERVRSWFEGQHWSITEAGNGREALARLEEGRPDVIVLDLMMPEMNGFQLVAALQQNGAWRDIPVIVVTAHDLNAAQRDLLNSGVQSVLVKESFKPADLVARIRRLVGDSRAVETVS